MMMSSKIARLDTAFLCLIGGVIGVVIAIFVAMTVLVLREYLASVDSSQSQHALAYVDASPGKPTTAELESASNAHPVQTDNFADEAIKNQPAIDKLEPSQTSARLDDWQVLNAAATKVAAGQIPRMKTNDRLAPPAHSVHLSPDLSPDKPLKVSDQISTIPAPDFSPAQDLNSLQSLSQTPFPFKRPASRRNDSIARAQLTSDLDEFEPVDSIGQSIRVPTQSRRLYWFNELAGLQGEQVFHSWYYNDLLMSRVAVTVETNLWRASTYKTILQHQQGTWRVVTENMDEEVLAEEYFEVTR